MLIEPEAYFPFSFRSEQKETIIKIRDKMAEGKSIILNAPTGTGKTLIALVSTLCSVDSAKRIWFFSRTSSQIAEVIKSAKLLKNADFLVLGLHGQKTCCLNRKVEEEEDAEALSKRCSEQKKNGKCPYFDFENFDKKVMKYIQEQKLGKVLDSLDLKEWGRENSMCPYQIIRSLLHFEKTKIIALNYIYLLNTFLRELILGDLEGDLIIIDEAHNLPGQAEEQLHAQISKWNIGTNKNLLKTLQNEMFPKTMMENTEETPSEFVKKCNSILENCLQDCNSLEGEFETFKIKETQVVNLPKVNFLSFHLDDWFDLENWEALKDPEFQELPKPLKGALNFWKSLKAQKDNDAFGMFYLPVEEREKAGQKFSLQCFDSRLILKPLFKKNAILSLSGSINPESYALQTGIAELQLTKERNFEIIEMKAIFNPAFYCLAISKSLNTRFQNRESKEMKKAYQDEILFILNAIQVRTAIFFASFSLLRQYSEGIERYANKNNRDLFSEYSLSMEENKNMLKNFKNTEKAILLGVLGGRNSEGADFEKNCLQCVIVIGIPYAQYNAVTKFRNEYFEKSFPGGKFFAYIVPAFLKINQSLGRPLRSEKDHAFLFILDSDAERHNCLISKWALLSQKIYSEFTEIQPSIAQFVERLTIIEKKVENHEERILKLERQVTQTKKEVKEVKVKIRKLSDYLIKKK